MKRPSAKQASAKQATKRPSAKKTFDAKLKMGLAEKKKSPGKVNKVDPIKQVKPSKKPASGKESAITPHDIIGKRHWQEILPHSLWKLYPTLFKLTRFCFLHSSFLANNHHCTAIWAANSLPALWRCFALCCFDMF